MWTKRVGETQAEVVFRYERAERPLSPLERDGSDVSQYFRPAHIQQVEDADVAPDCLRLHQGDRDYPKAIAAFYQE